jgi:hypothetical protein
MPRVAKFRPIPAQPWRELNDTQRKVYTKLQEVFAGFLGHTDPNWRHLRIRSLFETAGRIAENWLKIDISVNIVA